MAVETREERYEAAQRIKDGGDLAAAVASLEGLVADHPGFALAHAALAATALSVACMRGGRIAEAEEALARSRMLQGPPGR